MDEEQVVVVRKIGLVSALVLGVCGTIAVVVICGTLVTVYGMRIVDRKLDELLASTPEMIAAASEWVEALPPAVADALNDRRAPEYRQQVEVSVHMTPDRRDGKQWPVVEVANNGDKLISLMSLRVLVEDGSGVPINEFTTYAATPLAVDENWRGPLMPGSKRRLSVGSLRSRDHDLTATVEVSELRVWEPEAAPVIGSDSRTVPATADPHHPSDVEMQAEQLPSQPPGAAPASAERAPEETAADPQDDAPPAEPPRRDQPSEPPHDAD